MAQHPSAATRRAAGQPIVAQGNNAAPTTRHGSVPSSLHFLYGDRVLPLGTVANRLAAQQVAGPQPGDTATFTAFLKRVVAVCPKGFDEFQVGQPCLRVFSTQAEVNFRLAVAAPAPPCPRGVAERHLKVADFAPRSL